MINQKCPSLSQRSHQSLSFQYLVILKAVEGIVSWKTNTLDGDNKPNKAGQAYIKLYQEDWRSTQELVPSQSAAASFSGFRGDYTVRIKKDGVVLSNIQFTLRENMSFKCVNNSNSLNCSEN